jgi:hypothetical protein
VKKGEKKGGAGREADQDSTALNYNPEFRHENLGGQRMVKF